MPVGWNCTNSMSISSAPARYASAWPSPVPSQLLLVILIGASDAAGRQHDGLGREHVEAPALAVVGQHAGSAAVVEHQIDDRVLHVDGDAEVHRVILQRANQLEAGAVADVRQARIAMTAEVALVDAAVRRAIEHRAPGLELAHAIGRFLGVELGHAPVVHVLAAAHRVGEVHLPAVAIVDVGHAPRPCRLRPSRCAPCRAATCR